MAEESFYEQLYNTVIAMQAGKIVSKDVENSLDERLEALREYLVANPSAAETEVATQGALATGRLNKGNQQRTNRFVLRPIHVARPTPVELPQSSNEEDTSSTSSREITLADEEVSSRWPRQSASSSGSISASERQKAQQLNRIEDLLISTLQNGSNGMDEEFKEQFKNLAIQFNELSNNVAAQGEAINFIQSQHIKKMSWGEFFTDWRTIPKILQEEWKRGIVSCLGRGGLKVAQIAVGKPANYIFIHCPTRFFDVAGKPIEVLIGGFVVFCVAGIVIHYGIVFKNDYPDAYGAASNTVGMPISLIYNFGHWVVTRASESWLTLGQVLLENEWLKGAYTTTANAGNTAYEWAQGMASTVSSLGRWGWGFMRK